MSEADWTSYRDHLTAFDLGAHATPEFDAYMGKLEARVRNEGILDSEDIEDLGRNELIFDRSYLAELNGQIRASKARWMKDDQEDTTWPDDFLIVGGSGCGDYYFISSSRAFTGVRIYEHEVGETSEIASNLDGYYDHILEDIRADKARNPNE